MTGTTCQEQHMPSLPTSNNSTTKTIHRNCLDLSQKSRLHKLDLHSNHEITSQHASGCSPVIHLNLNNNANTIQSTHHTRSGSSLAPLEYGMPQPLPTFDRWCSQEQQALSQHAPLQTQGQPTPQSPSPDCEAPPETEGCPG